MIVARIIAPISFFLGYGTHTYVRNLAKIPEGSEKLIYGGNAVLWVFVLLAIFVPLCVRLYKKV